MAASAGLSSGFPFQFEADPPQQQNRLSVLLRIIFVIPQLIALYILAIGVAVVTLIAWFAILITGSFPAGMHSFSTRALQWQARVLGYMYLLTDKYPPFALGDDTAYPLRFVGSGTTDGRNRLTTFFRVILAIPHLIIVGVIGYVIGVVGFIAWIIALFTGSVPAGLHSFIAGYVRWNTRTAAYLLLLTDEYPPFALN
jgi:hypothetical protein